MNAEGIWENKKNFIVNPSGMLSHSRALFQHSTWNTYIYVVYELSSLTFVCANVNSAHINAVDDALCLTCKENFLFQRGEHDTKMMNWIFNSMRRDLTYHHHRDKNNEMTGGEREKSLKFLVKTFDSLMNN